MQPKPSGTCRQRPLAPQIRGADFEVAGHYGRGSRAIVLLFFGRSTSVLQACRTGSREAFFIAESCAGRRFCMNRPLGHACRAWRKIHGTHLGESVNRFFRSNQPWLIKLGPLEQRLLEEVWARKTATVRELIDHGQLEIAYTTVMTTMDRLHKKGLLSRIEENRAFRYFPLVTKEEVQRQAAGQVIQQLLASGPASLPLSYLVDHHRPRQAIIG